MLTAEPFTEATEAADDLIHHQQDVIFRQHGLDGRPVAVRRHDRTAGTLHGLGQEGGHVVRAQFLNTRIQCFGTQSPEIVSAPCHKFRAFTRLSTPFREPVGLANMRDAGHTGATLTMHGGHATQAHARDGRAVIAILARDDPLLFRLALERPEPPYHAQHAVIGFRTGTGEEDMIDMLRRETTQLGRQLDRRRVGGLEEGVVVRQLRHLLAGRRDQFRLVIAEVHAPQPRHAIENPLAIGVMDIDAAGTGDDTTALLAQLLEVGEGVQVVARIQRLQAFASVIHCHLHASSRVG